MGKKIFLAAVILSVAAIVTFYRYGTLVAHYRIVPPAESPLMPQYVIEDVYREQAAFFTLSAAVIGFVYFLSHLALYFFALRKSWVNNPAALVFCIAIALLFCVWNGIMFLSPRHISFDEVYVAWVAVAMIFMMMNYIFYNRTLRKRKGKYNPDVLDSEMEE